MSGKTRIVALVLAIMMLCSTLIGVLGMWAGAAEAVVFQEDAGTNVGRAGETASGTDPVVDENTIKLVYNSNPSREIPAGKLTYGTVVDITLEYTQTIQGLDKATAAKGITVPSASYNLTSAFSTSKNPTLKLIFNEKVSGSNEYTVQLSLKNVTYTGSSSVDNIAISFKAGYVLAGVAYEYDVIASIPTIYTNGTGGTSSGTDDETNPYSSDIIVENVYLTDSTGERLDEVTKDSPPFTLVITYAEYGLKEVDDDEFTEDSLDVYLTDAGGFITGSGAKGTLKYLNTSTTDAPRFRASFPNLKYKEGGSTSVTFRSNYNVYGWEINGKANATVNQVDDKEKDKLSPLKPHIIVNQYSYGERQIVAGENFTLNMSIKNTSAEIPLENIVMTISPETIKSDTEGSTTGGLTITSASNTYYIEKLDVGGSFSHSIDLKAQPNAAVGSHKVVVQFSFQYVDEVNEKREESSDEENIAIPVTQIDRFSVDPITEIPDVLMAGEDGYITVSFINRGKTTTYNISGVIKGNLPSANQSQHFGNLEAGKAGTLDFEVVGYEPGDMKGEIVMQYEDENAEEIEISLPFSIRIEEQYIPEPPPMDPNEGMEETGGTSAATLVLCVVGGLLMATPIALYLFKRVKAKGIEALDEDF